MPKSDQSKVGTYTQNKTVHGEQSLHGIRGHSGRGQRWRELWYSTEPCATMGHERQRGTNLRMREHGRRAMWRLGETDAREQDETRPGSAAWMGSFSALSAFLTHSYNLIGSVRQTRQARAMARSVSGPPGPHKRRFGMTWEELGGGQWQAGHAGLGALQTVQVCSYCTPYNDGSDAD